MTEKKLTPYDIRAMAEKTLSYTKEITGGNAFIERLVLSDCLSINILEETLLNQVID